MSNSKKTLLMLACAVMLVLVSVMGTMAYLTSADEVKNTFTVGNVKITLDEAKVDAYGDAVTPAERVKANGYKLLPGHNYKKDPTVTVKSGSEASYVRMLVTINKKTELDAIGFDMRNVFTGYSTDWVFQGQEAENDTMTYEFRYNAVVPATTSDLKLPALFTGIAVPGELTGTQLETLEGLKIDVVAQAIQADGFGTADKAWTAFAAQ